MSEPVSNVEIEDVLSSIRRLVSEENRSEFRPEKAPAPVQNDRLILTQSLRVAGSAETETPDHPPLSNSDTADTTVETATDLGSEVQTELVESDLETQVGPDQAETHETKEFELDSSPVADPEAELQTTDDASDTQASESNIREPDSDQVNAPWRDPETTLYEAADSKSDLVFNAPTDDSKSSGDNEQFDLGEDGSGVESETPERQSEHDSENENAETADGNNDDLISATDEAIVSTEYHTHTDDDAPEARPTESEDAADTASLGAKIAALEAKIGRTQDQWEPDGESSDDYAGTRVETIQWQDHDENLDGAVEPVRRDPPDVSLDTPPSTEPEAQSASATALDDGAPADATPQVDAKNDVAENDDAEIDDALDVLTKDDTILDEESLRELVADIVREELQGALGERITRNVRKLVRREIHRALTAQQLD